MRTLPFTICIIAILLTVCTTDIDARILSLCTAAKELKKGGVSNTFISNWVCLMNSESGLNTNLIRGPGTASSYSYGVFQINSANWCKRGRKGGICNGRCEDYANDDISDDIVCAQKIQATEGFKHWKGWINKCKKKPLPDVSLCNRRRRAIDDIFFETE